MISKMMMKRRCTTSFVSYCSNKFQWNHHRNSTTHLNYLVSLMQQQNSDQYIGKKYTTIARNSTAILTTNHANDNTRTANKTVMTTRQQQLRSFSTTEDANTTTTSSNNNDTNSLLACPIFQYRTTNLGLLNMMTPSTSNNSSSFINPTIITTIRQLPEVDTVLSTDITSTNYNTMIESLVRAATIFESLGSSTTKQWNQEHIAILAILAECYVHIGRYDECIHTLHEIQTYCSAAIQDKETMNRHHYIQMNHKLSLALAKVYWMKGDFQSTMNLCNNVMMKPNSDTTNTNNMAVNENDIIMGRTDSSNNIFYLHALSGYALSRLLLLNNDTVSLDDIYTVRDPFRKVIKSLERQIQQEKQQQQYKPNHANLGYNYHNTLLMLQIQLAVAYLNMGCAEIVYAESLTKIHTSYQLHTDIPLDHAMRCFKNGIQMIDKIIKATTTKKNSNDNIVVQQQQQFMMILQNLKARFNANLAWGLLQMANASSTEDDNDAANDSSSTSQKFVQQASEYARKSLESYSSTSTTTNDDDDADAVSELLSSILIKEGYRRTLTLIAECYIKSGAAVTAEGLLQSAIAPAAATDHTTTTAMNPCHAIELRDAHKLYGTLCCNWDQRESYGKQLHQQADEIDTIKLPGSWQGKSNIHSTLWFWTPLL